MELVLRRLQCRFVGILLLRVGLDMRVSLKIRAPMGMSTLKMCWWLIGRQVEAGGPTAREAEL